MKKYTVVGMFYDNKQLWIGHIRSSSVRTATSLARKKMRNCSGHGGGAVLCIFNGYIQDVHNKDELIEN